MRCTPSLRLVAFASTFLSLGHAGADSSGRWQSSQEAFQKVCAYCHEARVGPVITGRGLPVAYVTAVVRNGNRAMPAFRESEMADDVLAGVARFIAASPADAK